MLQVYKLILVPRVTSSRGAKPKTKLVWKWNQRKCANTSTCMLHFLWFHFQTNFVFVKNNTNNHIPFSIISICGKKVSRKLTILNGMWLLVLFLFTLDICGGEKKNIFALNLSSTGAQPCWQNRSDLWNQCNEKEENKDTLVLSVKIVCLGAKRWTDNKRRRK